MSARKRYLLGSLAAIERGIEQIGIANEDRLYEQINGGVPKRYPTSFV